ncbi:hypothetical protein SS05631_a48300 (plasmid) [Sinorhizobium sp. CCBAU 05631]|nr:hypothetical protein SS05631_a48300 [Sinorhizobium sp. CCBAU 05631]
MSAHNRVKWLLTISEMRKRLERLSCGHGAQRNFGGTQQPAPHDPVAGGLPPLIPF